jgi:hypothetical protein
LSNDSEAVVFKVSKAIGPSLDELHFPVKALSDSIGTDEAPHTIRVISSDHDSNVLPRVTIAPKEQALNSSIIPSHSGIR